MLLQFQDRAVFGASGLSGEDVTCHGPSVSEMANKMKRFDSPLDSSENVLKDFTSKEPQESVQRAKKG